MSLGSGVSTQATIGDVDPLGLTNPGELHLELTPGNNPVGTAGLFGGGDWSINWWLIAALGVAAWLILRR